jgi:hypothetical protein
MSLVDVCIGQGARIGVVLQGDLGVLCFSASLWSCQSLQSILNRSKRVATVPLQTHMARVILLPDESR